MAGVDGIFYSTHSHTCCSTMGDDPRGEDVFGFNDEVVFDWGQSANSQ